MGLDKIPQVDMWSVSKSSRIHRRAVLGFVPRIGLPIVNYADVDRIDAFYLECQNYRDYYRDPYNQVHKPSMFCQPIGKCGIKPDTSIDELRQPISWIPKRQPLLLPIDYKSHMNLGVPMGQIFKGRYNEQSCIRYKR